MTIFKYSVIVLCCLQLSLAYAGKRENTIRWVEASKDCAGIQAQPRFEGTFCENLVYLKSKISSLASVTEILGSDPVVFLGDTHPNILLKRWLARELIHLKSEGFTHVALEAINSESQEIVNTYLRNRQMRPQIVKLVSDDWGWIPKEHVDLIDAVHAAGLQILAIDNRNELERRGLGNDIHLRNIHMAEKIANILQENASARVVVLTGKIHSALVSDESSIKTVPEILKDNGISSSSFNLESGEEPVPKNITQAFLQELGKNNLPLSGSGDYFLPAPLKNSDIHGIIFISR